MDLTKLTEMAGNIAPADILAAVTSFEVPVPDAAILAVFAGIVVALQWSHRGAVARTRARLEAAYAEELVTANRRLHHARADLSKARREIEHERQKKRGLQRGRPTERAGEARPISVLRGVASHGSRL